MHNKGSGCTKPAAYEETLPPGRRLDRQTLNLEFRVLKRLLSYIGPTPANWIITQSSSQSIAMAKKLRKYWYVRMFCILSRTSVVTCCPGIDAIYWLANRSRKMELKLRLVREALSQFRSISCSRWYPNEKRISVQHPTPFVLRSHENISQPPLWIHKLADLETYCRIISRKQNPLLQVLSSQTLTCLSSQAGMLGVWLTMLHGTWSLGLSIAFDENLLRHDGIV